MDRRKLRTYKVCEKCKSNFTLQNFERHQKACKGVGNRYAKENLICYTCNKKGFSSLKDYSEHQRTCEKAIQAGLNKRGQNKPNLGTFNCQYCGRLFENKRHCDLVSHERCCYQNPNRVEGSWKGRRHSTETKIKIAQSVRNRLGENFRGFYNKDACEFIENINLEKGFNFQHQLKGGEYQVGPYFLDGYDSERNIAIEFNEAGHYLTKEKIEKDEYRRNYILEKLNCKFFVYNDKEKQFEEYDKTGQVRIFKDLKDW